MPDMANTHSIGFDAPHRPMWADMNLVNYLNMDDTEFFVHAGRDEFTADMLIPVDTPEQAAYIARTYHIGEHIPDWLDEVAEHAIIMRMLDDKDPQALIDRFVPDFDFEP